MYYCHIFLLTIVYCYGYPATLVETLLADQELKDVDNSIGPEPYGEEFAELDKYFKRNSSITEPVTKANNNYTNSIIPFNTVFEEKNKTSSKLTTTKSPPKLPLAPDAINSIIANGQSNRKHNESRVPRRELDDSFEVKASQEDDSGDEGGGVGGLLTALLSGLSGPDGSINLEAITGLLGSLSSQNPDGSYDFSGLSDTLRGFFGGGPDGGGSDIGAFVGGLLGAAIRGLASPPGAKGAGILAGKVVTGVLPALSAPAPVEDGNSNGKPAPGLDSGSFVFGFLKPFLAASGGDGMGGGKPSTYTIIKAIISMATGAAQSFAAASSAAKSQSDW